MDETLNMAAEAAQSGTDGWDSIPQIEDGEIELPADGQSTENEPADAAAREGADGPEDTGVPEERFAVKYNGQTMTLTRDEMTTLAQKGMNYDKVNQRLQQALDGPEHRLVAQLAAANGLTPQEYLLRAEDLMAGQFVREQVEQGVPEQTARQMWLDRQELTAYREQAARDAGLRDAAVRQDLAMQAEFAAFVAEYPDVETLPPEVIAIKQANPADSITSAYRKWELGRLRTQMQARDADIANRETAPGSAAGAGRTQTDPFLAGWDGI